MKPPKLPGWDLSGYYKSPDDPKLATDMKASLKRAEGFANKYRGRITSGLKPRFLLQALRDLEAVLTGLDKPVEYAQLIFAADTKDPKHGRLKQQMVAEFLRVKNELLFFDLALLNLSPGKLKSLAAEPLLSNYKHYLKRQLDYQPHHLSEPEERILNDKYLTSAEAFNRLFEETISSQKFAYRHKGRTKDVSSTEALNYLYSPDRSVRQAAAAALTAGLEQNGRLYAFIHNTLAADKAISDRYRKYPSPEASRHLDNELDQKTVEAMVSAVVENYDIVQKYYKELKKHLKLPRLAHFDRYAPLQQSSQTYSFSQAKDVVLRSFKKLAPEFYDCAELFFANHWIDAAPRDGKQGGAFCSYGSPATHPVVFLNYHGTIRDVETLAHELGHAVNAYLMGKQTYLNFGTPLTLAETASTFGEMLVFEDLYSQQASASDKRALLANKLQRSIATIFRQVAMFRFEQDFHAERQKGELPIETINQLWMKRNREMFGGSVDLTGYEFWWMYIPHFLHTPFYVYAYAFGELLSLSLFAQFKKDPQQFAPRYLKFLAAGSSGSPSELLAEFGIKLADKKFWLGGISILRQASAEFKHLK